MLTENARKVLERRYFMRDELGNALEDAEGMFRRVAGTIAGADAKFDEKADTEALAADFYRAMTDLDFLPNSPTLMNAGRPLGQLSACFVLPVADSMEDIFEAVKNAALIHKSGGGTGFSFSRLRPAGAAVRSTGGVASGPVSFMKVFNTATEAVKQGGTRRGANMGILRVDHPDILDFISCKQNDKEISNFNISVGLTEAFMNAVMADADYDLIDPRNGEIVIRQGAKEVFDLIVEMAWKNGEPGIVFLDRINRDNPTPQLGEIEATNPCGEQPLLPYESCNLGSINLGNMLTPENTIDYDRLRDTVELAVHFLDNVIEVNRYPLPEIDEMTRATRKIGLGVMGFADMLFRLGVSYASEEGVKIAEEIMGFIDETGREASRKLAEKRGAFPKLEGSLYAKDARPPRNATITTIAPTGTISIIGNCSSGVEPLFALAFTRNVMDNTALPEVHPYFLQVARERGFYSDELMRKIAQEGSVAHIAEVPEDVRRVFVTAHDISPEHHVRMQAAFQQHTDNAVSKTVNFGHAATREDVREAYMLAYSLGLKGITIYRDGSRDGQVLNVGSAEEKPKEVVHQAGAIDHITPRKRPNITRGITEKVRIGCGNLYVTVNYDDQGICEVFTNLGRAGGCPSQSEATSRLVSMSLRAGMDPNTLIEQLRGIRCLATMRKKSNGNGVNVLSCPDAIGRVLEKVLGIMKEDGVGLGPVPSIEEEVAEGVPAAAGGVPCPDCGAVMEHEGGCVVCRACGYSKCN